MGGYEVDNKSCYKVLPIVLISLLITGRKEENTIDSLTPEERSKLMALIKNKNTRPERTVRSLLHKLGFRFRLHPSTLPGKPDIVLPRYRTVVFVQGCFWHRHEGCKDATIPKTNTAFWTEKFRKNVERDRKVHSDLVAAGWKVMTVWECETQKLEKLSERLQGELILDSD